MNNFDKSQSAHCTSVADSIAPAGQNAFTACVPRSTKTFTLTAPRKRGPKTQAERIVSSLRTDEERANIRILAAARRVNPESVSGFSTGMALHRKEIRQELARAA